MSRPITQLAAQTANTRSGSRFHFARHLVEMLVAMMAGMMVGAFALASALGTSVPEARREHAVAWVVVMAFGMAIPMAAVMLYRGHSRRSAAEMAAAMIVPAVPIVACELSDVGGEIGRAYMPVSMIAMIALIIYRRSDYREAAASHA